MAPPCHPLLLALKWRGHSISLVRIGSALSSSVELCRALSSCRAVELDTLTPRHMESGGFCRVAVEVCRAAVKLCRAILSSSCRVAVEQLSSNCRVSCRVVEARAQGPPSGRLGPRSFSSSAYPDLSPNGTSLLSHTRDTAQTPVRPRIPRPLPVPFFGTSQLDK